MAEALLKGPMAASGMDDLLTRVSAAPILDAVPLTPPETHAPVATPQLKPNGEATAVTASAAPSAAIAVAETDEALTMEPYIESERCTTCNECTNLNAKMFVYNADKQATIKDPRAGTFQQLVLAAERCPVGIIHPGSPLNPKEKDLEKWIKRAAAFN
jgi:pyruvate-ferredoxin/flavodoxin oxidoreductase